MHTNAGDDERAHSSCLARAPMMWSQTSPCMNQDGSVRYPLCLIFVFFPPRRFSSKAPEYQPQTAKTTSRTPLRGVEPAINLLSGTAPVSEMRKARSANFASTDFHSPCIVPCRTKGAAYRMHHCLQRVGAETCPTSSPCMSRPSKLVLVLATSSGTGSPTVLRVLPTAQTCPRS